QRRSRSVVVATHGALARRLSSSAPAAARSGSVVARRAARIGGSGKRRGANHLDTRHRSAWLRTAARDATDVRGQCRRAPFAAGGLVPSGYPDAPVPYAPGPAAG